MEQERFDTITRTLAARLSRRGLLGAGAASVALLAAKRVAAGKAAKPNPSKNRGTGPNGPLSSGQNGSPGPSPNCSTCEEGYDGCTEPCEGEAGCLNRCQNNLNRCNAQCPTA